MRRRVAAPAQSDRGAIAATVPWITAAVAFVILYWRPLVGTVGLWWTDPDAGHGLLLVPAAVFLAWRSGLDPDARGQAGAGAAVLIAAVVLRSLSALAAELFTMRLSAVLALCGILIYARGFGQLRRWWLPVALIVLSMPLPELLTDSLALPLQFRASRMGAALLNWRHVPAGVEGNVIVLGRRLADGTLQPATQLFVTEACSGLRSLAALLALGFLIGGIWLRTSWGRALLVIAAIPIAVVLNGVRVFLTGFAVFWIDESLGRGLMHYTEGWGMFVAALIVLSGVGWLLGRIEPARPARDRLVMARGGT